MLKDLWINELQKSEIALYAIRIQNNWPMKEIALLTVVICDDVNLGVAGSWDLSLECVHHGHCVQIDYFNLVAPHIQKHVFIINQFEHPRCLHLKIVTNLFLTFELCKFAKFGNGEC